MIPRLGRGVPGRTPARPLLIPVAVQYLLTLHGKQKVLAMGLEPTIFWCEADALSIRPTSFGVDAASARRKRALFNAAAIKCKE